jgi:Tol biopolymer transport system component
LHAVTDLDWSPDGEHLALQTDYGAYIIDDDGTNLTQIEPREAYAFGSAPSWTSDSRHIVFASNRDGNAEIYTLDLDTNESQRLTDNSSYDVYPAWQPVQSEDCSSNTTSGQ